VCFVLYFFNLVFLFLFLIRSVIVLLDFFYVRVLVIDSVYRLFVAV